MNNNIITIIRDPYKCTIKKLATATRNKDDYDYIINYYNGIIEGGYNTNMYFKILDLITYIQAINKYKTKKKFIDINIYNKYCKLIKEYDVNKNKEYINSILQLD